MTQISYLARNRAIAKTLIGGRLRSLLRLLNGDPEDPIRLEWGPALLELDDGSFYLIDCEESKSNIIVFELPADGGSFRDMLARRPIRPPVVTLDRSDPLRFMLEAPIAQIDEVSREPEEDQLSDWYEMCGLRIHFVGGGTVIVGTELTSSMVPSTAFMLPDEVDPALRYSALKP